MREIERQTGVARIRRAPSQGAGNLWGRLTRGGVRAANLPWADLLAARWAASHADLWANHGDGGAFKRFAMLLVARRGHAISLKGWHKSAQGKRACERRPGNRITAKWKRPERARVGFFSQFGGHTRTGGRAGGDCGAILSSLWDSAGFFTANPALKHWAIVFRPAGLRGVAFMPEKHSIFTASHMPRRVTSRRTVLRPEDCAPSATVRWDAGLFPLVRSGPAVFPRRVLALPTCSLF